MKLNKNEVGALNVLLIPLIIASVLLVSSLGFGAWSYMSREDYKNNSDKKSEAAVAVATKRLSAEKDNEFLEKEKYPLDSYKGPASLGSIQLEYPKTWSAYISETDEKPFFIFNPKNVNAGRNNDAAYGLRITIEKTAYSEVINDFDTQIKKGALKASAYSLPKVSGVVGVRFDGEIAKDRQGSVIVLPLRDKTIKIANEAPEFVKDFNDIILPTLSFSP